MRIACIICGSRNTVGAVSIPATAPSIAARPQPSASIQETRTPTSLLASGLSAAARSASPSFVKRKKAQSAATAPTTTASVPTSWSEIATPPTPRPLDRGEDRARDRAAAHEGDRERGEERSPEGEAVVDVERPRDVRREHRHLALREVDDARGAVDEHDRERERGVAGARGEAGDDLLPELAEGEGDRHRQYPR